MTPPITPLDAFALAYLPAVCGFTSAKLAMNDVVGSAPHDEKLAHALDFSRKLAPLVSNSPKSSGPQRLAEVAARIGLLLPPMPGAAPDVEAWIKLVRERGYVLLPGEEDCVQHAAFQVGLAAGDLHCGARIGDHIIYLRCSAPQHPFLAQRAIGIAHVMHDASQRLLAALDRPNVPAGLAPLRTQLAAHLAKMPDQARAADSAAHAQNTEWLLPLWSLLNDLGPAFGSTSAVV